MARIEIQPQKEIKLVPTEEDRFESLCTIIRLQSEVSFGEIWEVIHE